MYALGRGQENTFLIACVDSRDMPGGRVDVMLSLRCCVISTQQPPSQSSVLVMCVCMGTVLSQLSRHDTVLCTVCVCLWVWSNVCTCVLCVCVCVHVYVCVCV